MRLAKRVGLGKTLLALAALGLLAWTITVGVQDAAAQRARDLASFDRAWEIVRDRHFDPELGDLDWQAVRAELRPRMERRRG